MMRSLRKRLGLYRGTPDSASAVPHWQRVPKIDFIPRRQSRTLSSPAIFRLFLTLVVLGAAYLSFGWYQDKQDIPNAVAAIGKKEAAERQDLTDKSLAIATLQEQIQQIKTDRAALEASYKDLFTSQPRWQTPLSSVFAAQVSGVEFSLVTTEASGVISLSGTAESASAAARLQARLAAAAPLLTVQSMNLTTDKDGVLQFTAILEVKR